MAGSTGGSCPSRTAQGLIVHIDTWPAPPSLTITITITTTIIAVITIITIITPSHRGDMLKRAPRTNYF